MGDGPKNENRKDEEQPEEPREPGGPEQPEEPDQYEREISGREGESEDDYSPEEPGGEQTEESGESGERQEPTPGAESSRGGGGDEEDYLYEYEDFEEEPGAVMPLGDHLEELRSRIIKSLVVLALAFIGCWVFYDEIWAIIDRPHRLAMEAAHLETSLKFGSYTEPIITYLKACLIASAVLTAPFLLYQAWAFIGPGLFRHERRQVVKLALPSFLCLAAGVGFGYFLFIPLALRFLLSLSGAGTEPVLMIGSYLSLFFLLTLALGVAFQTPLVMYLLVKWNIVDVESIQKHRKAAMLVAFALAAVLTPPDPATQVMMALPLVMLYDIGALAGAPSKMAFFNFIKFAGTIALIVGAITAWYFLWPIGKLTVIEGQAIVGGNNLKAEQTKKLRRGRLIELQEDAAARFWSGDEETGPSIYMKAGAKVQTHSGSKFSFYEGRLLAVCTESGDPLEVRTKVATVLFYEALAEMSFPDPSSVKITVFQGKAEVKWQGQERLVTAGHTDTFRRGGRPIDDSEIGSDWGELLGRDKGGQQEKKSKEKQQPEQQQQEQEQQEPQPQSS